MTGITIRALQLGALQPKLTYIFFLVIHLTQRKKPINTSALIEGYHLDRCQYFCLHRIRIILSPHISLLVYPASLSPSSPLQSPFLPCHCDWWNRNNWCWTRTLALDVNDNTENADCGCVQRRWKFWYWLQTATLEKLVLDAMFSMYFSIGHLGNGLGWQMEVGSKQCHQHTRNYRKKSCSGSAADLFTNLTWCCCHSLSTDCHFKLLRWRGSVSWHTHIRVEGEVCRRGGGQAVCDLGQF